MIVGLLIQIVLIALVVFGIRAIRNNQSDAPIGYQFRNFFQYLILLVVFLASVSGFSGLLGMLADRADFVAADTSELALHLSLVVVGVPLFIVVGLWTRKRVQRDPTETRSLGWNFFFTIGILATLVTALFGAYGTVRIILRATEYDGFAVAQAVVWTAAWYSLDRIDRVRSSPLPANFRHVVAATIGLALGAVAISQLGAALIERAVRPGSLSAVLVGNDNAVANAVALVIIASPVWIRYWVKGLSAAPESDGWRLYVVLFGVAGGLITAIVSTASLSYSLAVWYLGSPVQNVAAEHFASLPTNISAAATGSLVWWYHRTVLQMHRGTTRLEIDRTYNYVMAGAGLVASAAGIIIVLSGFVEVLTGRQVLRGDTGRNTVLLAIILLAIGAPVWWSNWRRAMAYRASANEDERDSVSRRIYLITLVGLGGLFALGAGIATVYLFLRDVIDGRLSISTFRSIRYPLAILVTSGGVALYHLGFYRIDHQRPDAVRRRIVLVGPADANLLALVRSLGPNDVQLIRTAEGSWQLDEVEALLATHSGDVVVTLTPAGIFGASLDAT